MDPQGFEYLKEPPQVLGIPGAVDGCKRVILGVEIETSQNPRLDRCQFSMRKHSVVHHVATIMDAIGDPFSLQIPNSGISGGEQQPR